MDKKFGIKHVVAMGIGNRTARCFNQRQIPVGFIPNTAPADPSKAVLAFSPLFFGPLLAAPSV